MLEQAQRVFDGEAVLKLLSEVDKDYPDYDQLEMWVRRTKSPGKHSPSVV
jgi:hypothetical protein